MSESKPAFVFVGGVSHTAEFFEETIKEMAKLGYDSEASDYPSCGDEVKGVSQADEVAAIQKLVLKYLDEKNQDVVLLFHSYGGWPGSRAVKGLDKEARQTAGKSTGIIEIVSLASFLLPENSPGSEWTRLPPWITDEGNRRKLNEKCIPLLFNDMDEKAQQYWFSRAQWHENNFDLGPVTDLPWDIKSLKKTAIILLNDLVMTVPIQFHFLQAVIDTTWNIKSLNTGHEPFLSQPANLAKILIQPTF